MQKYDQLHGTLCGNQHYTIECNIRLPFVYSKDIGSTPSEILFPPLLLNGNSLLSFDFTRDRPFTFNQYILGRK